MVWTKAQVLDESARWVSPWNPPGAELVVTDRIRLYVDRGQATILRAEPADRSGEADLVDEVFELCRARGAMQVRWTVRPGVVGDAVMAVLLERGGVIDERTDICFWDLGSGVPAVPVPADVEVWPVRGRAEVVVQQRIDAEVWGHRELDDREIDEQVADLMPGRFVAFVGDRPAGSAGYSLAASDHAAEESVARLWGAGVVPLLRHRGAYRGLLQARLDDALTRGATLALVHARAGTSGPILRRLGFTLAGQQAVVAVPVRSSARVPRPRVP